MTLKCLLQHSLPMMCSMLIRQLAVLQTHGVKGQTCTGGRKLTLLVYANITAVVDPGTSPLPFNFYHHILGKCLICTNKAYVNQASKPSTCNLSLFFSSPLPPPPLPLLLENPGSTLNWNRKASSWLVSFSGLSVLV